MYARDCGLKWLFDSENGVCENTDANLKYIRTYGKCPPSSGGGGVPGNQATTIGECPSGTKQCSAGSMCTNSHYCSTGACVAGKCSADGGMLGPGGTQSWASRTGGRVPDNMDNSKHGRFIPDNLDGMSISREQYEEMGKNFMKDEAKTKGIDMPPIHDSEAEMLGRMVWRLYVSEMEQKRSRSQKATDAVLEQEIQLLNKVTTIMKTETDNYRGKKHQGLGCGASKVQDNGSKNYYSQRTDNMFSYSPNNGNDVSRKNGRAFQGHPVHGTPRYFDQTNALDHCFKDHRCGGVNFNSTTGEYTLMPKYAKIVRKRQYTAFVKNGGGGNSNNEANQFSNGQQSPYQPVSGIGSPVDPNKSPQPYNSLWSIFS